MISGVKSEYFTQNIDSFISSQVTRRGLDVRTEKAYRLDLEHLYHWMEKNNLEEKALIENDSGWEERIQEYFTYLSQEKRLRPSTISRKYRVIGYYLTYLAKQGMLPEKREFHKGQGKNSEKIFRDIRRREISCKLEEKANLENFLSKQEVDAFFRAIRQEYKDLNSDFRRRVCLRNQIMMELLFYHGLEVSELLKMEISDYEPKTGVLVFSKKRERGQAVELFSKELQERMRQWVEEHKYFELENEFQGRMFLSKLGRPLSMKMVINIFEKYRLLAGIKKECTPKDLKKSRKGYAWELMKEAFNQ